MHKFFDHDKAKKLEMEIDNTDRADVTSAYDNAKRQSYDSLVIDRNIDALFGIKEQNQGNQYYPTETTIQPDKNGYYDLTIIIQGQTRRIKARIQNGVSVQ